MKFEGVVEFKIISEVTEPKYRNDRPPDRALLVSNGKETAVLHWIGPALDWWYGGSSFEDDFSDTPAGVWIWEGKISTSEPDDTYLDGSIRELTPEEFTIFRKGGGAAPWDDSLWILPEEEPPSTTNGVASA